MKSKTGTRLSFLEEALLAILLGRELYGLEIIKAIKEATQGKRSIGFGSLYPTLHQLEKRGLVKARWGDEKPDERKSARRRYYTVTGIGEAALKEASALRKSIIQWKPQLGRA
jgi:DNA-binding PadR family transcriptional regulator